jgi:hypothetical protein
MHRPKRSLPTRSAAMLFAAALLTGGATQAEAATITYNFGGSTSVGSLSGNERTYLVGGVELKATAWYFVANWQPAALNRYSNGLGVCNSSEGTANCIDPNHYVDNVSQFDFVLFLFDQPVIPTHVGIWSGGYDRDASYRFGTVDPATIYGALSGAGSLPPLGFDASWIHSLNGAGTGSLSISLAPTGPVNALIFGAQALSSDRDDRFKISSLTIETVRQVPEPMSMGLFALGLLAAASRLRRRS